MHELSRTILVAHRDADVRRRFAAAMAEAQDTSVEAATEAELLAHAEAAGPSAHLVLLDLRIGRGGVELIRALRKAVGGPVSVVAFASTTAGAAEVAAIAGLGILGYVNDHSAASQILPALAPYLYPDNFNRRMSPRVSLGVPVSYRAGHVIAGAVTLDVGKGGLAVRTMTPLPSGTAVQIKFRLPGTPTDLEAGGRVVWSDRKVGMGVQFETIEPAHQAMVDAFVDAQSTAE
jgi:uncharacterized protein (TIGR02266 family)